MTKLHQNLKALEHLLQQITQSPEYNNLVTIGHWNLNMALADALCETGKAIENLNYLSETYKNDDYLAMLATQPSFYWWENSDKPRQPITNRR